MSDSEKKHQQISDDGLLKELHLRFKEKNEALSDLRTLAEQLQNVNKKLKESESLKSHFISNITNEIVNPFTSILGLSKTILSVEEGNWSKIKTMASLIHAEAFSLDFQLKNIFAAGEIEAGEATPQILNVNICELVRDSIDSFALELEKKQIEIILSNKICENKDSEFIYKTDPGKLQLILANLIDNAIKFSSAANRIEFKLWIEDEALCFSIRDYGMGISPEEQKIIFDRFKRIDPEINSIKPGHGLGLSITKSFLDLLDGTIQVESQRKLGSLFTISLPKFDDNETKDYSDEGTEMFFGEDEII